MSRAPVTYRERARAKASPNVSLRRTFVELHKAVPLEFKRRPKQMRFRIPADLKMRLIDEFEEDYVDTVFGDLSAVYRENAIKNWGMLFAGMAIELDDSLDGVIALDSPHPPPPARKPPGPKRQVAPLRALREAVEAHPPARRRGPR